MLQTTNVQQKWTEVDEKKTETGTDCTFVQMNDVCGGGCGQKYKVKLIVSDCAQQA